MTDVQNMKMEDLRHLSMGEILSVCRCHKKYIDHRVSDLGMYENQHHLLMYLERNPNVSQTHLARELNISTAAVTTSLKKLEAEGYITRSMDEKDNRYNQVEITQKGREIICQSLQIFQETDRNTFDGFSREELSQLCGYLERIYENMKAQRTANLGIAAARKKCSTEQMSKEE